MHPAPPPSCPLLVLPPAPRGIKWEPRDVEAGLGGLPMLLEALVDMGWPAGGRVTPPSPPPALDGVGALAKRSHLWRCCSRASRVVLSAIVVLLINVHWVLLHTRQKKSSTHAYVAVMAGNITGCRFGNQNTRR